jgi:hypothetical protein
METVSIPSCWVTANRRGGGNGEILARTSQQWEGFGRFIVACRYMNGALQGRKIVKMGPAESAYERTA